ncbi:carbohydrate-binding module family 14 protein [Streptomyces sp. P9(2023)]|uniref:carbohydrate-binding module family 14 protein n=1 Tax=Streptomyces sp. P9(2023) TaxID=3064394 RepID=UPI0028F45F0B|nr:carbohydrate-binding module family 14 protein [Streptomyces sp. P9(2023)]MDT9688845.1 carbohydrate-binding module family 14 protein [Streptomyces sp. P9(2023)]
MAATLSLTTLAVSPAQAGTLPWPKTDCPSEMAINAHFKVADPNDPRMYSECNAWFPLKKTCKNGMHFSPTQLKCMRPEDAGADPKYAR